MLGIIAAAVVVIAALVAAVMAFMSSRDGGPPDTSAIDSALSRLADSEYVQVTGPVKLSDSVTAEMTGVLKANNTLVGSLAGDSGIVEFVDTGEHVYVHASSAKAWTMLKVVGDADTGWARAERGRVLPDALAMTPRQIIGYTQTGQVTDVSDDGVRTYDNGITMRSTESGGVAVTTTDGREFTVSDAPDESVEAFSTTVDVATTTHAVLEPTAGGPVAVRSSEPEPDRSEPPAEHADTNVDTGPAPDPNVPEGGSAPVEFETTAPPTQPQTG